MAEDDPPEVLAGEYVLGVLDAEERTAFELRMVREPALAQLVQDWQARLLPLDEELAPITPSPEVWRRNGRTIRTQQSRPRTAWWNRLGLWCGWAVAATASAFGLLVLLAVERVPTPQLVAVLNDSNATRYGWSMRARIRACWPRPWARRTSRRGFPNCGSCLATGVPSVAWCPRAAGQ